MEENKQYKLHPIQLNDLRVGVLSIDVDLAVPKDTAVGGFSMETGHSAYNAESQQIQVKMRIEMGQEEGNQSPFKLVVELHALFQVDDKLFNIEFIEDWAEKNAPLVIYPYIREHVYSLTGRAGFQHTLLPLIEIPTFKVMARTDLSEAVMPAGKKLS